MKRLLRILELTKNEQRVVLIVVLVLVAIAFVGYERRVHQVHGGAPTGLNVKPSPSPEQIEENQ